MNSKRTSGGVTLIRSGAVEVSAVAAGGSLDTPHRLAGSRRVLFEPQGSTCSGPEVRPANTSASEAECVGSSPLRLCAPVLLRPTRLLARLAPLFWDGVMPLWQSVNTFGEEQAYVRDSAKPTLLHFN